MWDTFVKGKMTREGMAGNRLTPDSGWNKISVAKGSDNPFSMDLYLLYMGFQINYLSKYPDRFWFRSLISA